MHQTILCIFCALIGTDSELKLVSRKLKFDPEFPLDNLEV